MRYPSSIFSRRRVLCIFPAYTPSFGIFSHAYRLLPRVRAFMPPQGLLLIAAYLPASWSVRFIDENVTPATAGDFGWADFIFVSGMHIQAPQIHDIAKRAKRAGKVIVELDEMLKQPGHPSVVYFVDDNFIGNRKAAREMLPQLIDWQRKRDYPLQFACEATLNLAKQTEILSLMRQAQFVDVFVGIETPEADALKQMHKEHNSVLPMMEAIKTLNSYGLEVTSGIILGLDTDGPDTESRLKEFIDLSQIPILTINLLQALPRTPLWDRLKLAGRLIVDEAGLESNVRFLRPHDDVVAMWQRCVMYAYDPERLFARFAYQVDATFAHRLDVPARGKLTIRNLREAVVLAFNLVLRVGLLSNYRRSFWRAAYHALKRGQIDAALGMGLVAYHLIQFSREVIRGDQNASFNSARSRALTPPISSETKPASALSA